MKKSFYRFFLLIVFLSFAFLFLRWPISDLLLEKNGKTIIGEIISERGYNGQSGHFLKEENGDKIDYMYSFELDNKIYKGDSQSDLYKIGDTIKVIYLEKFPFINRPDYYLKK